MNLSQLDLKEMYDWPLGIQIVIMILLFALVILFGYVFDLGPKNNEIISSRAYETDLKNSYKKTIEEQVKANGEINLIPQLETQLKNWQSQLTPTADMPVLLDTILRMGRDSNLHFNEFSPGTEVRTKTIAKIPVTVRLDGTYDQIGTFLSNIANYKSLIAIKNLVIVKPEVQDGQAPTPAANATPTSAQDNTGKTTPAGDNNTPSTGGQTQATDSSNDTLNAELTLEIYKR